jgi:hypothetical protein
MLLIRGDTTVDEKLQCFWDLESFDKLALSPEQSHCEQHFTDNTAQPEEGRFVIHLPFKMDAKHLGRSRQTAQHRLLQTENMLSRKVYLRCEYHAFMQEYQQLGHMQPGNMTPPEGTCFYIPHHPVQQLPQELYYMAMPRLIQVCHFIYFSIQGSIIGT